MDSNRFSSLATSGRMTRSVIGLILRNAGAPGSDPRGRRGAEGAQNIGHCSDLLTARRRARKPTRRTRPPQPDLQRIAKKERLASGVGGLQRRFRLFGNEVVNGL